MILAYDSAKGCFVTFEYENGKIDELANTYNLLFVT